MGQLVFNNPHIALMLTILIVNIEGILKKKRDSRDFMLTANRQSSIIITRNGNVWNINFCCLNKNGVESI